MNKPQFLSLGDQPDWAKQQEEQNLRETELTERLISLQAIVSKRESADKEETYKMLKLDPQVNQDLEEVQEDGKTLIVKHQDLSFNDQECKMFSFIDITNYIQLEQKI